jgi:hypothetical protein
LTHSDGLDFGAGDGIRTHDIYLGKVVLYQLSYSRITLFAPTYFCGEKLPTIIGADVLNCRVRDGIGWFHVAMGTKRRKIETGFKKKRG